MVLKRIIIYMHLIIIQNIDVLYIACMKTSLKNWLEIWSLSLYMNLGSLRGGGDLFAIVTTNLNLKEDNRYLFKNITLVDYTREKNHIRLKMHCAQNIKDLKITQKISITTYHCNTLFTNSMMIYIILLQCLYIIDGKSYKII